MSIRRAAPSVSALVCGVALVSCVAAPVSAQDDPNPGAVTITGAFDMTNAYMFRGIPQNEDGVIMWPAFDLGLALRSSDTGLRSLGVNIGTWNSLQAGTWARQVLRSLWYESDFYATVGLGVGGGVRVNATYTAYISPNGMFTTVKELSFKIGADDSAYLGKFAVKPYAIFAFELDTEPFVGQADGGLESGRYLEIGAAPGFGWSAGGGSVAVPVKVGLSMGDYYETVTFGGPSFVTSTDDTFGFFSVAGIVRVPLSIVPAKFGTWNVHGGMEYQRLGERNGLILDAINDATGEPEKDQFIISVGIGFSY
ncbi:MAG TPA: hypothetical protein VFV95_01360 [Vicinamibacterales bacterium]|nr:hypothetical protein [Vicinamibacterales bacterium]